MLESEIEKYLIKKVKVYGGITRKINWIGRIGAPDRLVIVNNVLFFVELKKPRGLVRPTQTKEHRILEEHGQLVYVIDKKEQVDEVVNFMMIYGQ